MGHRSIHCMENHLCATFIFISIVSSNKANNRLLSGTRHHFGARKERMKKRHTYTYTLYQVNEEGRGISECNAVHHYAISYTMKSGWFPMQVKGMKSEIEAEYTIFLWFGLCHNFEGIFTSFFLLHRFSFGYFFIVFRCKRLYLLDTFQYTYRQ